jgi:hypothetical protein
MKTGSPAQFRHRIGAPDDHVTLNFYARLFQPLDFLRDDFFWQAEFGNAIDQHAAGFVQRLINRHIVSLAGQLACRRQTCGAGADDGDPFACRRRFRSRHLAAVRARPVRHIAFQMTDAHWLALGAAHALDLALRFLRADASRDAGQGVVAQQTLRSLGGFALHQQIKEFWNVHAHRAALDAARVLALQAAVGFQQRELLGEAEVDLRKI